MKRLVTHNEIEMMCRRVGEIRKEKGWSLQEMASRTWSRTSLSPEYLSRLEQGQDPPAGPEIWRTIVVALGLTEGRGLRASQQVDQLNFEDIKELLLPKSFQLGMNFDA